MKPPSATHFDRAARTLAEIAGTDGLADGVVVFHPRGLASPRWYPQEGFEAPLSEVWVPLPTPHGRSEAEVLTHCRQKLAIAIECRQDELERMMSELRAEGNPDAERQVSALLYERPRVRSA